MSRLAKTAVLLWLLLFIIQPFALAENLPNSSTHHFPGWEKLNLPLRHYLEDLNNQKIDLIISTNKKLDETDKQALLSVGFESRSVVRSKKNRTLLTGSILPSQIDKLAGLPFIEAIEGSPPLQIQKKAVFKKS